MGGGSIAACSLFADTLSGPGAHSALPLLVQCIILLVFVYVSSSISPRPTVVLSVLASLKCTQHIGITAGPVPLTDL